MNPVDDSATTIVADSQQVAGKENMPQPEEIVIDKVLRLLANENIGGPEHQKLWKDVADSVKTPDYNSLSVDHSEGGDGGFIVYEVGAFLNPNGSYQVVVFDNSGLDMFSTHNYWSYIYDGEKLTPNNVSLPKPRFTDVFDPVSYFGIPDVNVVNKLKTASLTKYIQYRFWKGKLMVVYNSEELDYHADDCVGLDKIGRAYYDWDGDNFVFDVKQSKDVIGYQSIGNLKIGKKYQGEPIESYSIKPDGASYECWKNGEKYFTINTEDGVIKSFQVFTKMLSETNRFNVGANLNDCFDDFELSGNIVKNADTWIIEVYPHRHVVVNAEDVVGVNQIDEKNKMLIFKNGATLKELRIL